MTAPGSGLLSPTHRRLWVPAAVTDDMKRTAANLLALGWIPYNGPARVDARGWIIDGSDPRITPRHPSRVYPKAAPGA